MPTIERTSSGMEDPGRTEIETTISDLRSKLVAGRIIYASEINTLITMWNRFNDHFHRADDLYGIDNYGNVGSYGGSGAYDTTNEATYRLQDSGITNAGDVGGVDNTQTITATKHNEISARYNSANGHSHYFDDRTS